ncbi:MAG: alpha/beta hydrolase [Alphaproteobacteria bacterium]|nr:alpha/beta hydrolase [Alphaproteobacteria bacterium]
MTTSESIRSATPSDFSGHGLNVDAVSLLGEKASGRFVEVEGTKVHVDQEGDGPDLFLIHGASSDMAVFRPSVAPRLARRYRLSAYDRPGLGRTASRPARAHTLEVQARVAAGVIEALELRRPLVLAHSWGGAIALRLALDRPDLTAGLILVAPVAYEWPGGVSWHLYWSGHPLVGPLFNHVIARPFLSSAIRAGVAGTFHPLSPPDTYVETARVMRAARPGAMAANGRDLLAAKAEIRAQQGRYPEIQRPVAVLSGDRDTVVRTSIHTSQLSKSLRLVRAEVLEGVGHVPHEAAPDRLEALVDWVHSEAAGLSS